jgi:mevalonate kinase
MPAFTATAPGKAILFGEHAVVYDRPAIAIPVRDVQAQAVVIPEPTAPAGEVHIQAADIGLEANLADLPADQPISRLIRVLLDELQIPALPACTLRVSSSIPIAAGLGSGAAISVAVLRALSAFLGRALPLERVSALAYEVEKLYHGTPSGIDNTVVTFNRPVFYKRGEPFELFRIHSALYLIIADTGIRSPTSVAVGDVRRLWEADREVYESIFDRIAGIVLAARQAIERGQTEHLGVLMDENQSYLVEMGVSSRELDNLVSAARSAGALGAKLSGAGRGGNVIALGTRENSGFVSNTLLEAGAIKTIITRLEDMG